MGVGGGTKNGNHYFNIMEVFYANLGIQKDNFSYGTKGLDPHQKLMVINK